MGIDFLYVRSVTQYSYKAAPAVLLDFPETYMKISLPDPNQSPSDPI